MLAAGAVGYVLGARAGRERYDQIVYQAQRLWTSPNVQRAATEAQQRAREAVPVVAEKVGEAAKHAAGAAASAVRRNGTDSDEAESAEGAQSATRDESAGSAAADRSSTETKVSHL
jgi:hypothetical protein